MRWNDMGPMQRLMVQVEFFNQSFPMDDVEGIESFLAKCDEDMDGEYTRILQSIPKDLHYEWRAFLKNALRELDKLSEYGKD